MSPNQRPFTGPSDGDEVRAFLRGDQAAFERLVDRYQRSVLRLCQRLLSQTEDAGDLFQDVFLQAFRRVDGLRQPEAFRTWLFRIAVRRARHYRERRSRRERTGDESQTALTSDPDLIAQAEDNARLQQALATLPRRQREVVILRHYEELSYAEIGEVLKIREDAARASHYQGLRRLRQEMTKRDS